MTTRLARQLASQRMTALWRQPAFRAARSKAASDRMKLLWATPGFVDKQLAAAVRNWSKPDYQQRQGRLILAGKRPMPLANQPDGPECAGRSGEVACARRGPHAYHVAVVGTLADASLRLVGWWS